MPIFGDSDAIRIGSDVADLVYVGGVLVWEPAVAGAYYFAAAGDDTTGNGSQSTPWQTIAKANSLTLQPGESLLFNGGDTFGGSLAPTFAQDDNSANPVTIGSYGTGRAAIATSVESAIYIEDAGGVDIVGVDCTGGGVGTSSYDNPESGIVFYRTPVGLVNHIRVTDCDISGFHHGIVLGSYEASTATGYNDVVIDGCVTSNCKNVGVSMYGYDFNTGAARYDHTNVTVVDCVAHSNLGVAGSGVNTGHGIVLGSVDGGVIERCVAYNNGENCDAGEGPVGIWAYNSNNVTITRCVSYDNNTGGAPDGGGFDLDINTSNSTIERCLAYGNEGPGILCYTASTVWSGNTVRYNVLWGNVRRSTATYGEILLSGPCRNSDFYGNTIVADDFSATAVPAVIVTGAPSGIRFLNNLFVTLGTGPLVKHTGTGLTTSDVLFAGNGYQRPASFSASFNNTTRTSIATWRSDAGQEIHSAADVGLYATDVGLVAASTAPTVTTVTDMTTISGLKLEASSPVAELGLDLAAEFSFDLSGVVGYFGGVLSVPLSIGAHEVGGIAPVATQQGMSLAGGSFGDASNSGTDFTNTTPGSYGNNWFYEVDGLTRTSFASVQFLAARGYTSIRIDFRWERLQPALDGALDTTEAAKITALLAACETSGVTAILECHNYGHYKIAGDANLSSSQGGRSLGDAGLPDTAFQDLWTRIVAEWDDHPAVFGWELMNEPVDVTGGAATWKTSSQKAVEAIRAAGSTKPVFVAGYQWSRIQEWNFHNGTSAWITDPLGAVDRLIYVGHHYWDSGGGSNYGAETPTGVYGSNAAAIAQVVDDDFAEFTTWLSTNGVRGAVTEFGWPDNAAVGDWNTLADAWFAHAAANDVHWWYWSTGPIWGAYELNPYTHSDTWHNGGVVNGDRGQATALEAAIAGGSGAAALTTDQGNPITTDQGNPITVGV